MKYVYPQFSKIDFYFFRFFGPGLGNLLFPWARAKVFAKEKKLYFLSATWPQLKLGRILRNVSDKRFYFGLFRPSRGEVFGFRRILSLVFLKRISEAELTSGKDGDILVFSGMDGAFNKLIGHHEYLFQEFLKIVKDFDKEKYEEEYVCHSAIAVHVRLGDFKTADLNSLESGITNTRLPLAWYVNVIHELRRKLGKNVVFNIFSDGHDSDLIELLSISGVKRVKIGNPVHELILMSQHTALIASASTFSMWASFFGQIPTIWFRGQLKQRLINDPFREIEIGLGEEIPKSFVLEIIR